MWWHAAKTANVNNSCVTRFTCIFVKASNVPQKKSNLEELLIFKLHVQTDNNWIFESLFHPFKILQAIHIRPGTVPCRTVPGRASADVIIYRRRPAPVRYVSTQEKIPKHGPVPERLNSPVMVTIALFRYWWVVTI